MSTREAARLAREMGRLIAEVLQDALSVMSPEQMEAAAVKVRERAEAADRATATYFESQAASLDQLARESRAQREGEQRGASTLDPPV